MGNINAPPVDYYNSFAQEILSKFRRVGQLTTHGPSSGEYHEEILKNILRNFLSKRFSVKTGFVYGQGRSSGQLDILIVDENSPTAYIFQEGDFVIVMPEAVAAVIEVKSSIGKKGFEESVKKIAQVKRLPERPQYIAGVIFSFGGGSNNDQTLDRWMKTAACVAIKDERNLSPEAIMFFSSQVMLMPASENDHQMPPPGVYSKLIPQQGTESIQGPQLSIMLAIVLNACIKKEMSITHYFPTVQAERIMQSDEVETGPVKFAMGEGIVSKRQTTTLTKD